MAHTSHYTLADIEAIDLKDVIDSVRGTMRCNSREEAEDAVSETIIRTMGRLNKLERRGRLDGFIVHAAKEKVLKHRRLRESGNLSLDFLEEAQPGEERNVNRLLLSRTTPTRRWRSAKPKMIRFSSECGQSSSRAAPRASCLVGPGPRTAATAMSKWRRFAVYLAMARDRPRLRPRPVCRPPTSQ